jgi:hypothetical protein
VAEDLSDVEVLANASVSARLVGDRALAQRLAAPVLQRARLDDHTRVAGAAAALTDAVLRAESGAAGIDEAFSEALHWARTDVELLAVFGEWSWAALFAKGPDAAAAVISRCGPVLVSEPARLLAEATSATLVGYAGRWGASRDRVLELAAAVTDDAPVKLQLTVHTLLAMAAGFDGPSALALASGRTSARLYALDPGFPMVQAACAAIGLLYGTCQREGFGAAAELAHEYTLRSVTGVAFVDYAGTWMSVLTNQTLMGMNLTKRSRVDADDAVRFLRRRDPCGLLSIAIGARALFAALCDDRETAVRQLDEYDESFRQVENKTSVLADRAHAWLAFQRGDHDEAVAWAERAWAASWERADVALWAAPSAHDLARFGRPELAVDRLRAAAARLDGPFSDALLAHAVALADADVAGLQAAADAFGGCGATGLQAEALLHAAGRAGAASGHSAALRERAAAVLHDSLLRTPVVRTALGLHAPPSVGDVAGGHSASGRPLEHAPTFAAGRRDRRGRAVPPSPDPRVARRPGIGRHRRVRRRTRHLQPRRGSGARAGRRGLAGVPRRRCLDVPGDVRRHPADGRRVPR